MDITEKPVTELEFIDQKIDWEGWPDALDWLVGDNFGDEELNQLIFDAHQHYSVLRAYLKDIRHRVDELQKEREDGISG